MTMKKTELSYNALLERYELRTSYRRRKEAKDAGFNWSSATHRWFTKSHRIAAAFFLQADQQTRKRLTYFLAPASQVKPTATKEQASAIKPATSQGKEAGELILLECCQRAYYWANPASAVCPFCQRSDKFRPIERRVHMPPFFSHGRWFPYGTDPRDKF